MIPRKTWFLEATSIQYLRIDFDTFFLKERISTTQQHIRENINATASKIIHRSQAINAKRPYQMIEEEQEVRQDILGE